MSQLLAGNQEIKVVANSGGSEYTLNRIIGWVLDGYDGLGIPEIGRYSQRGPYQQGDTDLGFDADARYLQLAWVHQGCDASDLWDIRERLISIFRPRTNDPTQLIFYLPNGKIRAADVNLDGNLDYESSGRRDGRTAVVGATLKASDPRLYFPTMRSVIFALLDGVTGWDIEEAGASAPYADDTGWDIMPPGTFEIGSGWNIGQSDLYQVQDIVYADGALNADIEYPVITIHGPIDSPTITNTTTGETLPLTAEGGLSLAAGEWVEIDLRYGRKTILDFNGDDVSQYLDPDNDLATFHLAYNSELQTDGTRCVGGVNVLEVSGSGVTPATQIVIEYYDRFVGV